MYCSPWRICATATLAPRLAAGFQIGVATTWRYVQEAIALLRAATDGYDGSIWTQQDGQPWPICPVGHGLKWPHLSILIESCAWSKVGPVETAPVGILDQAAPLEEQVGPLQSATARRVESAFQLG
jgi:hypothetical protein